ncbi:ScbR family autoregulator-binding transcription factor [Streptomyces sp. NPDC058739]|uniref:ScbR family autoregulator-binding transcription factor n=1 Tax=Streptomyces sp. NPDC058739 TaxID=3346618 RepID=UPI0036813C61
MVKQERAARTRRSLIQAAAEVFAEEGFVPASLGAISKRAGVSNGALHFHFANKSALADAVEEEAAATIRRLTEVARARHGDSLQAVVDATHDLIRCLVQDAVVRGGFELACGVARRTKSPLRAEWQRWVEDSLRRAEGSGSLADGVSWMDAAHVIVAVTAGLEVLGGEDASWLSHQRLTGLWALLLPRLADQQELEALQSGGSQPQASALAPASALLRGPYLHGFPEQ